MKFNLYNDGFHGLMGFDEEHYEDFREDLHELFLASPEAESIADLLLLDEDGDPYAHWTEVFLDMLYRVVGRSLSFTNANDIRDVLYDAFPQNVVIDEASIPNLIRELKAFFEFVNRELEPYSGASCLKVFSQKNLIPRLTKEFSDETKFGPIKTIVMQALAEGVEINDEASLEKFFIAYNQKMQAEYEALMNTPLSDKAKQKIKDIRKLVKDVCQKHLDKEYAEVSANMLDELATLRPGPFEDRAKAKSWAAGIVYAVAQVNFLSDPSFEPYMKMSDLAKLFNVGQETASTKAKIIWDMLDIIMLDPRWTVASLQNENPIQDIFNMFQLGFPGSIVEFPDSNNDDTPLLFIPPGSDIIQ